jgi:hypothetical protein
MCIVIPNKLIVELSYVLFVLSFFLVTDALTLVTIVFGTFRWNILRLIDTVHLDSKKYSEKGINMEYEEYEVP